MYCVIFRFIIIIIIIIIIINFLYDILDIL